MRRSRHSSGRRRFESIQPLGEEHTGAARQVEARSEHFAFAEKEVYDIESVSYTHLPCDAGADYGDRTRYLNLGKVALYQMS